MGSAQRDVQPRGPVALVGITEYTVPPTSRLSLTCARTLRYQLERTVVPPDFAYVEVAMSRIVVFVLFIAAAALFTTSLTGCEPCEDPSQLWCPDEW